MKLIEKPKSKWTKAAILAEAKAWANENGVRWRPVLERMTKEYLVANLLYATGRYAEHGYQARVLIHTSSEALYIFEPAGARKLLNPDFELPSTSRGKTKQKKLSKNARKRLKRKQEQREKQRNSRR